MAAGTYSTDLTDITLCESTTGFSALGGGGAGLGAGVDFAIQGTNAVDKQVSNSTKGMVFDAGTTLTQGANDHIFLWEVCATPGITSAKAAGGIRVAIGTATNAYYEWYVNGNDTLPGGGMQNYHVRYDGATASNTVGSPGATPRVFGGVADTVASAKGVNFALDAMRYGTGFYITAGDVTEPINFQSASIVNDDTNNRYAILSAIPGGYRLTGRFTVGQNFAGTPTQAYFNDANSSVAIGDTEFSQTDFTQLIFDHPSTEFTLDTVSFTAVGTNNRGQIKVLDPATVGRVTSNTFNNFGNTSLNAAVTVTGSSWINCEGVIQSGSSITTSNFIGTSDASGSIISDDPSLITSCNFEGDGTHHGIEVVAAGTYSFTGNKFTGFISGSVAGSELLFKPPGLTGDLVLNILGGGDPINFTNESSGTVTINNNIQVTLTGMKDFTEVRVLDVSTPSNPVELAGIENVVSASVGANDNSFAFSLAAAINIDIALISVNYVNQRITAYTVPALDSTIPVQQIFDRNYNNP